ncbi:MAG: ParB/RepB/Spo0J family partition protein [Planctomycetota bacterium]|jgi:ParB family chromosome partitioning protein
MAERKLGRGLDSILGGTRVEPAEEVRPLALSEVRAGPHQPRQEFDEVRLQELANSIGESGVLQPIIVRPAGVGYEIVAGERRARAARMAGLAEIPAVIRGYTDEQVLVLSLVENVQRADLNPIDKARAYRRLTGHLGVTQEEVARRIGLDRSSVANLIRLLDLPEEIQDLVKGGALGMGHARAIVALKNDAAQVSLAERVVRDDLSVRAVEELVRRDRDPAAAPTRRAQPRKTTQVRALEDELRALLGTKVSIRDHRGRGKITIEYYSPEDFEGVLGRLRRTRAGFGRPGE